MKSHFFEIYKRKFSQFGVLLLMSAITFGCDSKQQTDLNLTDFITDQILQQSQSALKNLEFDMALALADSGERRSPDYANPYFMKARIFSEIGKFKLAEQYYMKALKLRPDYPGVWNNLGNLAFRQAEYLKAIDFYQKELAINPSAISWRGIGRAQVELGNNEDAIVAFNKSLQLDNQYAPTYSSLGFLYEDNGEYEKALENARTAMNLSADEMEYTYNYAALLVKTGEPEKAIPLLRQVVEKWPWHQGSFYNLGQALVKTGQVEDGRKYLELAEKNRKHQAEIEHLENTIQAYMENPLSHARLAFAYRRVGRYNDAMHAYQVALHLDPTNVEIHNNVANLFLIKKDTTRAIEEYKTILRHAPKNTDVWLNLGMVYAMKKNFEAARRSWNNVLILDPENKYAKQYMKGLMKKD